MSQLLVLIEAEIPHLRRYARYLTRDVDRADDLVQECLVRAVAKRRSWQPGTNLRAWLFVILRNAYISELRQDRREPRASEVAEDDPGFSVAGRQEAQLALLDVQRAFERLSGEHRETLLLVAVEGLSYEEAAVIVEVPVGTVRSRLSRARAALREMLRGPEADEGQAAS
ncbi:MAG: sigma-70 family RNA polymerase sigma factor [Geminicoccaceae bacterium]